MFTVEEFKELLIDGDTQHFNIWDNDNEKVIFDGHGDEIPDEILCEDVTSIDNVYEDNKGIITLNIR